ncbi:hypothetical protein MMC06_000581 [Schaereria dolodes]|nr:hypothetical protein [Schaereria dolodes]
MEFQNTSVISETQSNEEQLDHDIKTIREQIKTLTHRRTILTSALLTSEMTQVFIDRANATPSSTTTTCISALKARVRAQTLESNQNLYRMCAGATMFECKDPDPHAVDEGRIIGIRIEAFSSATRTFNPPYYVLLNRPSSTSQSLHIHRHTVPPCIPLPALAAKYLPPPPPVAAIASGKGAKPQNLIRLVRELRREIVGYHKRQDAVKRLREELVGESEMRNRVKDVSVVNAEAEDLRIDCANGAIGRVRIEKNGTVEKAIVIGDDGKRKGGMERMIHGAGRIEDVAQIIKNR